LLIGFFRSLINLLHETDALYTDVALLENIAHWVAPVSSSTLRPFRHTATTVTLAMLYSLAEVAKKLDDGISKRTSQVEGEKSRQGKKKDKAGKAKLNAMQNGLDEEIQKRSICSEQMKEFFDSVFVHRYRDVDPRIRTECVEALGSWIWLLPQVYMEPEYLRYLGWMLSDLVPSTRQEVLRQLARVFKRDAQKLGHFIDRFRPRLIEMATKDSDVTVRVAAISVIENLRATGMLEPDEIDAIGRLVFDSELRVRRAVVTFFSDCVKDLIESKLEDIGGDEAIQELFSDEPEDFDSPREDWLNVKCLAETLAAYEAQLDAEGLGEGFRWLSISSHMPAGALPDGRITLAAQALFEKEKIVSNWEVLAGYLLHDHSVSSKSRSKARDRSTEAVFKNAVRPEGQEESILLEVLAAAVKASLAPTDGGDRHRKLQRADGAEAPETAARQLAVAIPKLLRKFGAEADTATIVLRLEHSLDLTVFQQLRQDSTEYSRLLDEICIQFERHADKEVISEATAALLHARQYDELEETLDVKISTLWEVLVNSLRNFDKTCDLSERNNLDADTANELSNVLLKISKLASVSDCVDVMELEGTSVDSSVPLIDILVKTVHRGQFVEPNDDLDAVEDELTTNAIQACMFYFMWKVRSMQKTISVHGDLPHAMVDTLAILKKSFQHNLIATFSSRAYNNDLRLFATGMLCDLGALFVSLAKATNQPATAQKYRSLRTLVQEVPPSLVKELISVYAAAERTFAKLSRKLNLLNEPGPDEDPMDDLDSDEEDDEEEEALPASQRKASELQAEQNLCSLAGKLVLAILAKAVDQSGPQAGKLKRRLLRNQAKLGPNYREVVAYLDESKLAAMAAGGAGRKKSAKAKGKEPAAREVVVNDGDVAMGDGAEDPFASPEPEEGTEEDLRRRELLDEPDAEDEDEPASRERPEEDYDVLGD
jgi:cohesin complex subunit SA-1/2